MYRMKKIVLLGIGCMALLLTGSSFAYWSGTIEHTNQLQADEMGADIVEEFQAGSKPEGTVSKKVTFQNNSSAAAFLRVSYAETWQKKSGDEKILLNNQVNGMDVAAKNWANGFLTADSSLWWKGDDGWLYYKRVLEAGGKTEPVLESVTFPDAYSGVYTEYADAEYQLYFRMELLQASDSAFTLNSTEVNTQASVTVFGKTARISSDGMTVSWK